MYCSWIIAPPGAVSVTLTFTAFDTQAGLDLIRVFSCPDSRCSLASEVSGSPFSGSSVPGPVVSSTGVMKVTMTSGASFSSLNGFAGVYTSQVVVCPLSGTLLTAASGSISDGSGPYQDNMSCSWIIAPLGAISITLTFATFSTEACCDKVRVYSCIDSGCGDTFELAGSPFSGSLVPNTILSGTGVMKVTFISDESTALAGFEASYHSFRSSCPFRESGEVLTASNGSIGDGPFTTYTNMNCQWIIAPPGAASVTLNFTAFSTQSGADFIRVFSCQDSSCSTNLELPGSPFTGKSVPGPVTSSTGVMEVTLTSGGGLTADGFRAFYQSTLVGPECPFSRTVLKAVNGSISDGKGDYGPLSDCYWIIAPDAALTTTLRFTSLSTELGKDVIYIYSCCNVSCACATLLVGPLSGNMIPAPVTSSTGVLMVTFQSDRRIQFSGFEASYWATYCRAGEIQRGGSCTQCPLGYFSGDFAAECTICPAGAYSTIQGASTCTSCPANSFNSYRGSASSDTCLPCIKGTYSPAGSTSCFDCSNQTNAADTGLCSRFLSLHRCCCI